MTVSLRPWALGSTASLVTAARAHPVDAVESPPPPILTTFYRSTRESILTPESLGGAEAEVARRAEKATGSSPPSTQDTGLKCWEQGFLTPPQRTVFPAGLWKDILQYWLKDHQVLQHHEPLKVPLSSSAFSQTEALLLYSHIWIKTCSLLHILELLQFIFMKTSHFHVHKARLVLTGCTRQLALSPIATLFPVIEFTAHLSFPT